MDRRKFFNKQLVEQADLNAEVTNTYNAIGNLMSDIGIFGIISGGDITEQAAPSMSVDMSGAFIGYDQDGERIYRSTADVIDCSQDYLGNPTVPATPGESVWISIHARFDYDLEDPKVIDGTTEYLTWAEAYEWRVVAGTPAVSPGHAKPAKPTDAILIADIELINGQTTILTANIDETRKDSFVFAGADALTVSAGAWTKLDSAAATVQDAFDSADDQLISRDVAGKIAEDLLPTTSGAGKIGQAGDVWGLVHADNIVASTSIKPSVNSKALGDDSLRWEGFFNTAKVFTGITANATGVDIGSSSERFDAFLEAVTAYASIKAGSNGIDIGDATNRFDAFLNLVNYYGALSGTFQFASAKQLTVMLPLHGFIDLSSGWAWNSTKTYITVGSQPETAYIRFPAINGADLDSMRIRWSQATSTTMTALIQKCDEDNAPTSIGSAKTISSAGSVIWDTIDSGLAEPIDLSDTYYRVKVTTASNEVHTCYMMEATYNITDILLAALSVA